MRNKLLRQLERMSWSFLNFFAMELYNLCLCTFKNIQTITTNKEQDYGMV